MSRFLIKGETVVVYRREQTGVDPGNNPIYDWAETTVEDVLVAPGPRADVDDSNRPDGVEVSWNLHFPKTWTDSLRGAEVSVRGGPRSPVVGDPQGYTVPNTPGRWNRPVELERVDG